MRHFAPPVEYHRPHFVAFPEKPDDLILANLIIVFRGRRPEFHFFQLRPAAALTLLVSLLVLLIEEFPVVGDLANRRVRRRRDLHQVKAPFPRHLYCFEGLHDAELPPSSSITRTSRARIRSLTRVRSLIRKLRS